MCVDDAPKFNRRYGDHVSFCLARISVASRPRNAIWVSFHETSLANTRVLSLSLSAFDSQYPTRYPASATNGKIEQKRPPFSHVFKTTSLSTECTPVHYNSSHLSNTFPKAISRTVLEMVFSQRPICTLFILVYPSSHQARRHPHSTSSTRI
ncbi:hypothetical protein BDR22DRAFT_875829, partial [Usnea florida]